MNDADEDWEAEQDALDTDAVQVLQQALERWRNRPPPPTLGVAAAGVRAGLAQGGEPFDWLRRAAGFGNELPADDAALLLELLAGPVAPVEPTGLPEDEEALLLSLQHADWLAAVIELVRAGPGASADPDTVAALVAASPEVEERLTAEEQEVVAAALGLVTAAWEAAGVTDATGRLTALGVWLLPRALAWAWDGEFDAP